MKNAPIDKTVIDRIVERLQIVNLGKATIREVVALVNIAEEETGMRFCRMEMGVPGLPPAQVGTQAELEALQAGVASKYPMMEGIKPLKAETARFVKMFTDIDVSPEGCIPTVGSMQGTYAAFMAASNVDPKKDTILFIDPGFPVQKQQMVVMGHKYETFDVFNFRGQKLHEKLESYLKKGNINSIVYSNPNNPSWICLTDEELQIIGELANRYDVIVMEDLAYFGMDFRKDLYTPGQAPFQPTVARYTDKYVMFISSSKIFSYAGQRIGMMIISDALFHRKYENLNTRFQCSEFGTTIVMRLLYAFSSGTCHSAQFALAAMFKAASDGKFNFVEEIKEYGEKARIMKKLFLDNGFRIVYEKDGDVPVADGFYFTVEYPGMTGEELLENILHYGISAITLKNTGSEREGLRACVSHVHRDQFGDLEQRLKLFHENFG